LQGHTSFRALILQIPKVATTIPPAATRVLALQLEGLDHQPPVKATPRTA
jgi:ABC-type proline/glycine betaine transport system permease subunit